MVRDATTHQLLTPVNIGSAVIKNRIMMSAMGTNLVEPSGEVTDRALDYFVTRAKTGPGLIMVEVTSVDEGGKIRKNQLANYDNRFKSGLIRLASAIKECGVKVGVQIHHGGRRSDSKMTGKPVVAPSSIARWNGEIPHELTETEIQELINKFAQAARRGKECGFDAVELHFGHGYLGAQFLSPLTNKRRDKYGGDLENRARFCLETIAATRHLVGKEYPIITRLSADEYIKGGINIDDAAIIAQLFEASGVDAINVSAGYNASSEEGYMGASVLRSAVPMSVPRGCFVHLAEAIKRKVGLPVVTTGRINDLSLAEQIIAEGKADIVALGRAFLADPEIIPKWIRGEDEDIRRCIACNECQKSMARSEPVRCAINAETGREREYRITPAARRKKVLIVGGGPGGMEAARVAAIRNHQVVLAEKEDKLGGNLLAAAKPDFKSEITTLIQFLSAQIRKNNVKVELSTSVRLEFVERLKPDVVILATGAKPIKPNIKGIEKTIVTDAVEVLTNKSDVGSEVVVIGGGRVGCEVAAHLAQQGKKITVVEIRNTDFGLNEGLALDEESGMRRWLLFDLWPTLQISVLGNSTFKEVTDDGVVIFKKESGERLIKCDKVIFAVGMTPVNDLEDKLKGKVPEVYRIGDCVEPRTVLGAIHEGAEIARKI